MGRYYLGLDNGGSKSKAALYDIHGKEIAIASADAYPNIRAGGFVEKDMNVLWQTNAKAIREVIAKAHIDPHDIAGVAPTGHGNGVYLIAEDGTPVAPGIVSTDTRAADIVTSWITARRSKTHHTAFPSNIMGRPACCDNRLVSAKPSRSFRPGSLGSLLQRLYQILPFRPGIR